MPRKKKKEESFGTRFSVKNFGPIAKGEVDLKNLTIFIGPNNSGKSYAAMLIHSLFQTAEKFFVPPRIDVSAWGLNMDVFKDLLNMSSSEGSYTIPPNHEIYNAVESFFLINYTEMLTKVLKRNFLIDSYDDLISKTSDQMEITFKIRGNGFSVKMDKNSIAMNKLNLTEQETTIEFGKKEGIHYHGLDGIKLFFPETIFSSYKETSSSIFSELANQVFFRFKAGNFYLPPSRSGMMQSRNKLISLLVKDFDDFSSSDISGIVKDFLSFFIDIQNKKKGKYWNLVAEMEKDLINGEVILESDKQLSRSIINYQQGDLKIPIERSSSTIQELAPLLLYLKYVATPLDYIFIEEPEAHLHPENQKKLARLLVKLIRNGLNVLITTHSDYLLEQLGTFVMMSGIDEKERAKKYKYDKDDFLKPDEVSPYLFKYNSRSKGYKIEPIKVSLEQGISMEEYARVAEELYNENADVQNKLADKIRAGK